MGQATGGGYITKQYVMRLTFSELLSSDPRWEAWDNTQTYPAVDSYGSTVTGALFVGTTSYARPMIALMATTGGAGVSWPSTATDGNANPNKLKGTTSYVVDTNYPETAPGTIYFNMAADIPNDLEPSEDMNWLLQCRYSYTGSSPTLSWYYNTGTEGSPSWTGLTPGTDGIRLCASGASSPYYANIPYSGTEWTAQINVETT